jgi:hypothetical protein
MTFYPLAEINRAAQDSSLGTTIKPVLRVPRRLREARADQRIFQ